LSDCRNNDVTFFDAELQGKGSTGCENFDSTSNSFISRAQLKNIYVSKLHINKVMPKNLEGSLILEHHVLCRHLYTKQTGHQVDLQAAMYC